MKYSLLIAMVVGGMLGSIAFGADEEWALTTADFNRRAVAFQSLDENAANLKSLAADAQPISVPMSAFLQLDRPVPAKSLQGRYTLCLITGDRLGGDVISLQDEQLKWRSPILGEMTLSIRDVRAISRGQTIPRGLDDVRTEDNVLLANGDLAHGIVTSILDGKVGVQTGADTATLSLDSAVTIYFASTAKGAVGNARGFRLRFNDDSSVTVPKVTVADGQVQFTLPGAASAMKLPLSSIKGIAQVNGPVSWLSSRAPSSQEQVSFSPDLHFPARMDQTVEGKGIPISFGAMVFEHGIGVHANSRLTWNLDGAYKALRVCYAIDNGNTSLANVTVRILLDGQVVHEQQNFHAGKLSPVIIQELGAAKTLTLEVQSGEIIDTQDRLNWIEPALLREMPVIAPAAAATVPAATAPATTTPAAPATSTQPATTQL